KLYHLRFHQCQDIGRVQNMAEAVMCSELGTRRTMLTVEGGAALRPLSRGHARSRARQCKVLVWLRLFHQPIGRGEPVWRLWIGLATRRYLLQVIRTGNVHDLLGSRIIGLNLFITNRPVLAAAIESALPKVVRMHARRRGTPAV